MKRKNIGEVKKILARHKLELGRKFRVKRLGIFGSYARNEQKPGSDVDILVEFRETPGLFEFMDLEERLAGLLGAKVDLVTKKALKPHIGGHILREVVYI